jgi:hypothetical protein
MVKTEQDILQIENIIYIIRGQKVMLDSDLAKLYCVETKYLNKSVTRNPKRFPGDFMFQLSSCEEKSLRFQIGTSKEGKGGRRYLPYVFTENGIAMLSSVLSSDHAIEINVTIMRIFTKLRSYHALENDVSLEVKELRVNSNKLFKIVFERLDSIEEDITPKLPLTRKKIGLKN